MRGRKRTGLCGCTLSSGLLRLCPESACQPGPSLELSSRLEAGGCAVRASPGQIPDSFQVGEVPGSKETLLLERLIVSPHGKQLQALKCSRNFRLQADTKLALDS